MDDFTSLEKNIIRELSCRLCLCTDVVKLKPLNAEAKRKIRKLFGIIVRVYCKDFCQKYLSKPKVRWILSKTL